MKKELWKQGKKIKILLKSGMDETGELISKEETSLTIQTKEGIKFFRMDEIAEIID